MFLPKSICGLHSHVISTPYTIIHMKKRQCNVTETSIGNQCKIRSRRGRRGSRRRLAHPVTSPTMVTSTTIGRGICFLQLCNTTKYWTQGCITRVITAMNRLFGPNPRLQKFKFKWLLNRGPQYNSRIDQFKESLWGIYSRVSPGLHKLWYVLISWADQGSRAHKCLC